MGVFDNLYSNNITSQQTPGFNDKLSFDEWKSLYGDTGDMNSYKSYLGTESEGSMDWLNNNAKGIGVAAQVGGLALSGYDTLFGDTAKKNKKQMQLLDQQIANNADIVRRRKDLDTAWAKPGGGGLAATGLA